jgi:hypothetical protein
MLFEYSGPEPHKATMIQKLAVHTIIRIHVAAYSIVLASDWTLFRRALYGGGRTHAALDLLGKKPASFRVQTTRAFVASHGGAPVGQKSLTLQKARRMAWHFCPKNIFRLLF